VDDPQQPFKYHKTAWTPTVRNFSKSTGKQTPVGVPSGDNVDSQS